jgi:flagellar hook-length control protein FliK
VAESASWKNVFKSDDYNKLLKGNITSQWLLKPGDVQNKENIENLYQRLGNQVKSLSNAINQTLGPESSLAQTTNNLQNNLDFMYQLTQMFQYVQLPLQMAGQNAHGDLYVYKNKHKKMSEDGSVSAILHLDMDNLGPLDVYVKLVQNKVTTNFYVADDSVIELINDNIHILNERLEKRGYSMNVNVMLHDDMDGQDAAVDEMLDVMKTPILSTQSFDARA